MKIFVSEYNPIKFYEYLYNELPGRNTRFMDLVSVEDAILTFQDKVQWSQPWQQSDTINIQIQADTPGLRLCLVDCREVEIASAILTQRITNWKEPNLNTYEATLPLQFVEEGYYYLTIKDSVNIYVVSDRIHVKEYWQNSIYLQYHHRKNKGDLAFDTEISFYIRVMSVLQDFQPGSDDTVYLDQYRNTTVLSSTPFRTYKMIIGDAFGVPDYIADKINRFFGLSHVFLDNIQFAKAEGSKMERNGDRKYPFAGWTIEIIEAVNKDATMFNVDLETKGFVLYKDYSNVLVSDNEKLRH